TAEIDQSLADDLFHELSLLRPLADRAELSLFGMDVLVGASDVQIAADHERRPRGLALPREALERLEKAHFGLEILAAVGDIDGGHRQSGQASSHDAILMVEVGMKEIGLFRRDFFPNVETDARVSLGAVPVAPISLQLAQDRRDLVGRGFELLQTQDVGTVR